MCNNDEFVSRVLNRREIVAMLGAAGAWMLMGCSTGDDDDEATATTGETGAATSTTTADPTSSSGQDSEPTATQASDASTATEAPAGATTTTQSAEPTATEAESADVATMEVIPACVVSPELTEGPYFVDENLNRSDIRSDPSSGEVVDGAPLELGLRVLQVGSDGCTPLEGAQVDVWQCDALGVYSDVDDPGFSTQGQQSLRGFQLTDADGVARFTTIYPGWYQGRTVHIHFKVRSAAGTGTSYEFTSQFFFDDVLSDQVSLNDPYAAKGERGTRNDNDNIYREAGDQFLLDVSSSGDGYAANFDIGVMI